MPIFARTQVLLLLSLFSLQTYASTTLSATNSDYWLGYFSDFGHIVTAPVHFNQAEWIDTALVVGAGGLLFALDGSIRNTAQKWRSPTTDAISNAVQPLGHWQVMLPAMAVSYGLSTAIRNPHLQETTLLSVESMVLSGAMVQLGKYAFHRYRPNASDSPFHFDGPSFSSDNTRLSLPCGDAGVAFSIASVVGHEYPDNLAVNIGAYGLATLVGLERINYNKHFASDVFFGGVLGYFTGSYLVRHHGKRHFSLAPVLSEREMGIRVGYE